MGLKILPGPIGGIFVAGILSGIIGIVRSLIYKYDDDNDQWIPVGHL
jgi:hypothetical protein